MASIYDQIFHPERIVSPSQQALGQQYLRETPGADFGGIDAYEGIQKMYEAKRRAQAPFGPMEKAKGTGEKTVRLGAEGFEPIRQGGTVKERIYMGIQDKRNRGIKLTNIEQKFEKKFLGISDSKKGPKSEKDWQGVWDHAKDRARSEKIRTLGAGFDKYEYEPTDEEISDNMEDAVRFKFPEMPEEDVSSMMTDMQERTQKKIDAGMSPAESVLKTLRDWRVEEAMKTKKSEKINLDITLPESIKTTGEALKHLMKNGMEEDQAKQWLRERL